MISSNIRLMRIQTSTQSISTNLYSNMLGVCLEYCKFKDLLNLVIINQKFKKLLTDTDTDVIKYPIFYDL